MGFRVCRNRRGFRFLVRCSGFKVEGFKVQGVPSANRVPLDGPIGVTLRDL